MGTVTRYQQKPFHPMLSGQVFDSTVKKTEVRNLRNSKYGP